MSRRHIEKSRGGEGGKNDMNVEVEGDREGSDVSRCEVCQRGEGRDRRRE